MTAAARPHDVPIDTMVAELVRPHQHREHHTRQARDPGGHLVIGAHITRVPSLLHQLEHAAPSGDGASRSGGYESRPVARLEAVDVLSLIDHQAAAWVRRLGQDDPGNTARCVTLASSLRRDARTCDRTNPRAGCCPRHDLEHDVRRWWTMARVTAGWDDPPYRPDVTCPICGKRGTLRIRLEERVGLCADCGTTWDPSAYQELAAHVRAESEARAARHAEPCWCPWPTTIEQIDQLCRRCGSGRCHRAITANHERAERRRAQLEARWAERRRRIARGNQQKAARPATA